jgi:TolB protein
MLVLAIVVGACTSRDSTPTSTLPPLPDAASDLPSGDADATGDDAEPLEAPDAGASAGADDAPAPSPTSVAPPEDPVSIPDLPGRMAVVDVDGDLLIGAGGTLERFVAAPERGRASQPTWSPDGTRLAYSLATDTGTWVVMTDADGTEIQRIATPFGTYFLFWTTDSETIGALGAGGSGTAFGIAHVGSDTFEVLASGSFFYFDWAPDGQAIVAHEGPGGLVTVDQEGLRSPLLDGAVGYQAPEWSADGRTLYAARTVQGADLSATGPIRSDAVAQSDVGDGQGDEEPATGFQIVAIDVETKATEVLVEFPFHVSFDVSPAGDRMAFTPSPSIEAVPLGPLDVLDLGTGEIERVLGDPVAGFEWSPDGTMILAMSVQAEGLGWHTIGEERIDHAIGAPPNLFLLEYLQFWNQYARTLTLWAPDSSAFVFPVARTDGTSEIWVQRIDAAEAEFVANGAFASWAP